MVSEQLLRDWDANAVSLGLTPKLDNEGRIIPIGVPEDPSIPEDQRKYYVIWRGRAVGIYVNWGLASAMVCRFSGNAYKSYIGLEAARTAWEEGPPGSLQPWTPPRPGPSRVTPGLNPLPRPHQDDDDDDFEFPDVDVPTRAPTIQVPIHPEDYRELRSDAMAVGIGADYLYLSSPASSTLSLSTSFSATPSTPSWMSSGTLSPGTVRSPELVSSMAGLSLGERFTSLDSAVSNLGGGSSSHSAGSQAAHSPAARAYTLTPTPVVNNASADSSGTRVLLDKKRAVKRSKGDPVYIVVRGERPGVYFDNNTALLAAGYNPAMKIVVFKSLKMGCLYFVQQYMAGKVGVPVFVIPADEAEETY